MKYNGKVEKHCVKNAVRTRHKSTEYRSRGKESGNRLTSALAHKTLSSTHMSACTDTLSRKPTRTHSQTHAHTHACAHSPMHLHIHLHTYTPQTYTHRPAAVPASWSQKKGGNRHVAWIPCRRGLAAYCTHSHVVSAHRDWPVIIPLRVFPLIKAVVHACCKIRMHHIVKQQNILVTGKMSGKQCQSWFYFDINGNLRYLNICPRLCVMSVLSSSKTAFYEIAS